MPATRSAPRKANLFIVGAPKCGTTAWMEYLRGHPDIYFPESKEDCFFALDLPNFRYINTEEDYSRLFDNSGGAKVLGEASAMYLFSEAAAKAIRAYNPDAKILIFLRRQEEYLPSLHNQFLREFSEEITDFNTVWRLSGRRPYETISSKCLEPRTLDYRAMGCFNEQVSRYLDAFSPGQIRITWFHDWMNDPRTTYLEILDFLDLQDDGRTNFPRINHGITYRSRRLVRFLYHPPAFARKANRLVKRLTRIDSRAVTRTVRKAIDLLSASGYKNRITPKLREEIRRYYAADNKRLQQRIRALEHPLPLVRGNCSARKS